MNFGNQQNELEAQAKAEAKKLKEQREQQKKERQKRIEQAKKKSKTTNPNWALVFIIPGIAFAIAIHLYLSPSQFIERLIISLLALVFILGSCWFSFLVRTRMTKK